MAAVAAKPAAVMAAFFFVANKLNSRKYHSKWIPLEYWAFQVNLRLGGRAYVKQPKLKKILEGNTDRMLDDNDNRGQIVMIKHTWKRLKRRRESAVTEHQTKMRDFYRVETSETLECKMEETQKLSQEDQIKLFQQSYFKYRALIQDDEEEPTQSTLTTNRPETIDTTTQPINAPAVRPVTPTTNALDLPVKADVKAVLATVLNPELLKRQDLFVGDGDEACDKLRDAMHKFGIKKQKELNEKHYRTLAPDDKLMDQVDNSLYTKFLDRFCCPFNKRAIQGFLTIATKMQEENKETRMLMLPRVGGKGHGKRLVAVVPSTTRKTLNDNCRTWLPKLYEALTVDNALNLYGICYQLIMLHKLHCAKAFDDACRAKGPVAKAFKMDPHRQIAMCRKANLTYEHLRVMRPFLQADRCNPLRSETEIRKLVVSPTVKPIFSTVEEEKTRRNAWYLHVDEVVKDELAKPCHRDESFDELHLILSADHGQKAFRCNVTAVAISENRKVVFEKHMLVGHIECRKDTRRLLLESGITNGINNSLKKACSSNLVCSSTPILVKLKGTADLAFNSLALGKESMSGNHCWRCSARWQHFQKDPFTRGEKWAVESMKERFQKLESGELSRKNKDLECGLTHPMLFDCIEIEDWMCPVLHAVDLLANTVFDYFQKYIWYRLEDVPLELIVARIQWAEAEKKKEKSWSERLEAEEHLSHMNAELEALAEDGLDETDDDYNWQHVLATAAKESAVQAKKKHSDEESAAAKMKKALKRLENNTKKYGKVSRDLWMKIQQLLKDEFNVYISVYHGGALEGNEARRLMRFICEIMARIKPVFVEFLSTLSQAERNERADKEELDKYCGGFECLFQYMDSISHFCYQPFGSMSDEDILDAKRCIHLATRLWHKLMPTIPMKVHAWQHLAEDLEKYRGMRSHHEQQIERAHQRGKKDERRLACLKDFEKKTNHILSQNATADSKEVQEMLADTEAKQIRRKRSKRVSTVDDAGKRASYLKSILLLPEITETFPSLLSLQQAMPRVPESD